MKNGFLLIDDIGLDADKILKKFKADKRKAVEGNKDLTKNYRQGKSLTITGLKDWNKFDKHISERVYEASKQYNFANGEFIGGNVKDTGYHLHEYKPGDVCKQHVDGGQFQMNIFLSCIFFLNTVKGGELVFPNQDYTVKPKEGSVLLFPASFAYPHFTKPSPNSRYVAVTWLAFQDFRTI